MGSRFERLGHVLNDGVKLGHERDGERGEGPGNAGFELVGAQFGLNEFNVVPAGRLDPLSCLAEHGVGHIHPDDAPAGPDGFPELVISVMGLLVLVGGYTGYRLLEIVRFRAFARAHAGRIP